MVKKALLILSIFSATMTTLWSQQWRATPYEIYGGLGTANYFGDIGGTADDDNLYGIRDLEILQTRPSVTAGLRYNFHHLFSLNTGISIGWLSGNDDGGRNEERGYVFNTIFAEPSTKLEFFFLNDLPFMARRTDRRGRMASYSTISAYVFCGFAGVFYHTMPNDALEQRREASSIEHGKAALSLPLGAGMKLGIANELDIGFEIGGRFTTTDYLDGFTSDFSKHNDVYYITSINLIYRINDIGL